MVGMPRLVLLVLGGLVLATARVAPAGAQGRAASVAVEPERAPRTLVLSDQARRFLVLAFRAFPTEFMGCMIGTVRGREVFVERIAPADVDPAQSTATWVVPRQSCEDAGWTGTVGTIHSHPSAERCWYFFPGTSVLSGDGQSFLMAPYPVDAIVCGERVVWINRALVEQQLVQVEVHERVGPARGVPEPRTERGIARSHVGHRFAQGAPGRLDRARAARVGGEHRGKM